MARLLVTTALIVAALCALPGAASAADCKNLKVTDALKADLRKAHDRITDREFSGPKGRVYHGRCGSRYYALANFKDPELGYQDQPEQFTRLAGHGWKDRGDTGGPPCDTRVPRALLRIWGFDC